MTDDVDRIMAVMDAAFDPAFGEAWTRRQVSDALVMPNTHYLLAGPTGGPPRDDEPAVGFALSRGAADEEELLLIAVDPHHRGRGIGGALLERLLADASARGTASRFRNFPPTSAAARRRRRLDRPQEESRRRANGPPFALPDPR